MNTPATALIAEDEPLLAQTLQNELHALWPELQVLGTAGDGLSAVQLVLQHRPDVLFFDIRMPGQTGLEAAAELAEEWPETQAFPLLVFVTAYDQYAIAAFEAQAVDYVLKPVRADRLAQTVTRLQNALRQRQPGPQTSGQLDPVLQQLRALLSASTEAAKPDAPCNSFSCCKRAWATSCASCRWPMCCTWKRPTNTCAYSPSTAQKCCCAPRSRNSCRGSMHKCSGKSTGALWCAPPP